jgi:hypothetical protein
MDRMKTEKRNGYEIHVRAVLVQHGLNVGQRHEGSPGQPDDGYLPLVQIVRNSEVCADWRRGAALRMRCGSSGRNHSAT